LYDNCWSQRTLKQARHSAHEFRDIDRLLLKFLTPRKSQQSLGQGRTAQLGIDAVPLVPKWRVT